MAGKPDDDRSSRQWQQASLALTLPMMMLAGPMAGFLMALGVIHVFKIGPPWAGRIQITGLILGVMAGVRETINVIRKISREN